MGVRRVVVGTDSSGDSASVFDGDTPLVHDVPGVEGLFTAVVWATDETPSLPSTGDPVPDGPSYFPDAGGTRFNVVRFPAGMGVRNSSQRERLNSGEIDVPAERAARLSTLHRTDTIDYGIVISGSVLLELESDSSVRLNQGDTVVLTGSPHGWVNDSDEACLIGFVILGANAP